MNRGKAEAAKVSSIHSWSWREESKDVTSRYFNGAAHRFVLMLRGTFGNADIARLGLGWWLRPGSHRRRGLCLVIEGWPLGDK